MDWNETIWNQFVTVAESPDNEIELATAALLIAATAYPQLDIAHELHVLDSLSAGASQRIGEERDPMFCINTLSEYLFDEVGFSGNSEDYYDPRNSFLNEVLSRRLGIPISLSLVCIEVGKRLGVPLIGVGMPGHFLVRHRDAEGLFIDPFHRGILLSEKECVERMREVVQADIAWDPAYLTPLSNKEYLARLLRNLKVIYSQRREYERALMMIDRLVVLQPLDVQERRDRGMVRYRLGRHQEAREDLQLYLDSAPMAEDAEDVQRIIDELGAL